MLLSDIHIHNRAQAPKRALRLEHQRQRQESQKRPRGSSTEPSSCSTSITQLMQRGDQQAQESGLSQQSPQEDAAKRHGLHDQQVSTAEQLMVCTA